jgi:uncharacterized protein
MKDTQDNHQDSQKETARFLLDPRTFGCEEGVVVERAETHISIVFLGPRRALKMKRALKLSYLDFSTPGRRREACRAEFEINRKTAPHLYQGVIAVTREKDGALCLGGAGEPVEWLVDMKRFDENALLSRMAEKGVLNRRIMEGLGETIASFHEQAEICDAASGRGSVERMIKGNAAAFAALRGGTLDDDTPKKLESLLYSRLEDCGAALDERALSGRIKRCHGDLHLRNIVLSDEGPVLFDAIEFDPSLGTIDVLFDLAFLLMDLDFRGLRRLSNICFNRYLDVTGDVDGLSAMGLFLSIRAAIRSHVQATAAVEKKDGAQEQKEAVDYLEKAFDYAKATPTPELIGVGGLSGGGKSRMAREVAPFLGVAPGALVLRSDVIRKRLCGVSVLDRLGPEGYTSEISTRTFETLYALAETAIKGGHTVVADAVFALPEQRQAIERVAEKLGVPFHGLWLEAPYEIREKRVLERQRNVSDVTPEVLRKQLSYDVGDIAWRRISSSGPKEETLQKGLSLIGAAKGSPFS